MPDESVEQGRFGETRELLRAAQAGDTGALDRLLERYQERLLARIASLMGDQARRVAGADDICQGVMMRIARDLDRFEPRDDRAFLRWATQLIRNEIAGQVRRHREKAVELTATELLHGAGRSPSSEAAARERAMDLIEALETLPPDQQEVIEMRYFESLSYAEIATRMDRSVNAVELLHRRGVASLGRVKRRLQ
ncbi:MAG: sigma-70 family RNA polymerase sigma factor [Planctomycetota bacterium]